MNIKPKSRNFSLDVIRSVAIFFVISVHFFLKTGYYKLEIGNHFTYIETIFRTIFMICVPLFIILSGYLLNGRVFSIRHYWGIRKVLIKYILCTILLFSFDCFYLDEQFSFFGFFTNVIQFKQYSWYIKKYIILYMLIPFINFIFNCLKTRKKRFITLCVLFTIICLPTFFSYLEINFNSSNIIFIVNILTIISNKFYTVLYYYIGLYFYEYKDKLVISKKINGILVILSFIITGTLIYLKYNGSVFVWEDCNSWNGFIDCINSSITFMFLLRIDYSKLQKFSSSKIFEIVSKESLYIYLLSYIFDCLYYKYFNTVIISYELKCLLYFIIVPCVFISSYILGLLVDFAYKKIEQLNNFILKKIINIKVLNNIL